MIDLVSILIDLSLKIIDILFFIQKLSINLIFFYDVNWQTEKW